MANRIVFEYEKMQAAATKIRNISTQYAEAADTFNTSMQNAMTGWEGDSKVKFDALITNSVINHIKKTIPELVTALADLLDSNAQSMQNADAEIASKIPDSL